MNEPLRQRALDIYAILDGSMPSTIRFLEQRDPFRFMISVILSAQTTDRTVNQVVVPLFDAYPTVHDLAEARQEDVERIIHATGFYRMKAKNIIACAKALEGREVPTEIEALVTLPGVGRKTANCVLGDVFGKPAIIVDTHFKRVVKRLGLVDSSDPDKVEHQIAVLLPPELHYRFSMTVNLFGRQTCHARNPECPSCPFVDFCPASNAFLQESARP